MEGGHTAIVQSIDNIVLDTRSDAEELEIDDSRAACMSAVKETEMRSLILETKHVATSTFKLDFRSIFQAGSMMCNVTTYIKHSDFPDIAA